MAQLRSCSATDDRPLRAIGGDYAGVAEVLGWLGRSFEASEGTIRVDLRDVIGNDHHVVAPATASQDVPEGDTRD
jgi:hypothetical protein